MSRENVEVVRQWMNAWNSGGFDAVELYWHEEIELLDPADFPDAGRYVGKEAIRRRVESYVEAGWDGQFRELDLVDAGEQVVATWRLLGRAPAGDMPIDQQLTFVVQVRDGKVRQVRQYLEKSDALEAAGLRE